MDSQVLENAKSRYEHIFKGLGKQTPGLAFRSPLVKPAWYDEKLILRARKLYRTYEPILFQSSFYGLTYGIIFPESFIPLVSTGNSANISLLFQRYHSTGLHLKCWYESDMFDPSTTAYKSLKIVRGLHRQVQSQFDKLDSFHRVDVNNNVIDNKEDSKHSVCDNDLDSKQDAKFLPKCQQLFQGVWFSQADMCAAQASFIGFIAHSPDLIGAQTWKHEDFEAFFHHWRCVGYCLGVTDEFNLCSGSVEDTQALCRRLVIEERTRLLNPPLQEGRLMGNAILLAFGSSPAAFHRYARVHVFNCDPETAPLSNWGERFQFAFLELFFFKLARYPTFLWILARIFNILIVFINRLCGLRPKYLAWKYPGEEYKFGPLSSCPFRTKINYKNFLDCLS